MCYFRVCLNTKTELNPRLICIFILLPIALFAQKNKRKRNFGKKSYTFYKHEFELGAGISNYLGELGGNDGAPKRFSPGDAELALAKFALSVGYRYNINPKFAVRGAYTSGKIAGSDELTNEPTRNYRNLAFETNINEMIVFGEFFLTRADYGHGFHRTGVTGKTGRSFSSSFHLGLGFLKFNPIYNGTPLQPLNTEGQGLPGAEDPYKLTTLVLPIGINLSYQINKSFRVGLDATHRFTQTDYLDDVSGNYYDKELIRAEYGDLAAEMSNRTDGTKRWTDPGAPRGNPKNDDGYFTLMVVATYTPFIKTHRSVKRRYKPKF